MANATNQGSASGATGAPATPAAGAGSPSAAAPPNGAAPANAHADAAAIHRPPAGQTEIIEVPAGAPLKLEFASTDAKYVVLDVDLVMMFPDGGKLILPGYAFGLVSSDSSSAQFADTNMDSQQLFALVNDLHLLDDASQQQMGSSSTNDAKPAPPPPDETPAPPAPPVLFIAPPPPPPA